MSTIPAGDRGHYELRFPGLFNTGRGYAFPCDVEGNVDFSSLSERARLNYLRAQQGVGREFFQPVKCACGPVRSCHA